MGLLALMVAFAPAPAAAASAEDPLSVRALGRDDAPVTIVEHSSLTCSHCADFHADTLPKIKEAYIDTGQVRLVFEDFPLGRLALGASMVARCVAEERYFGMLDTLFRTQRSWASSPQPLAELERLARFAGLTSDEFVACLDNRALLQGIQERAQGAQRAHGIESTPTFLVNGRKVVGAVPFEAFKAVIDDALAEAR